MSIKVLHTQQLSIVVEARPGAQLDQCIREALALCAYECVNVTLVHNGREHKVAFNDLLAAVQHPS